MMPQAIARSHRIGQTKEVRVIHLEAVADADAPAAASTQQQQQLDAAQNGQARVPGPSSTPPVGSRWLDVTSCS
jgi:hypothetical protein